MMGAMPFKFLAIQGMNGNLFSLWSGLFQLGEFLAWIYLSKPFLHYDLHNAQVILG